MPCRSRRLVVPAVLAVTMIGVAGAEIAACDHGDTPVDASIREDARAVDIPADALASDAAPDAPVDAPLDALG
jgi:hypothetical protein